MKKKIAIPAMAATTGLVALLAFSQTHAATPEKTLSSDDEREAYSLGVVVATQARVGFGDMDREAFLAGFSDALGEKALSLNEDEISEALGRFDTRRAEEARLAFEARVEANRGAGDAFRADFAQDPEVEVLASGLHYKVLKAGQGEKPAPDSTVTLHYRGSLVDGRKIDSSYDRSEPVTVQVDRAIPGWSEALTHMSVGSKWKIVLPPELAYGEFGAGELIEPGSTVIFEVELISTS